MVLDALGGQVPKALAAGQLAALASTANCPGQVATPTSLSVLIDLHIYIERGRQAGKAARRPERGIRACARGYRVRNRTVKILRPIMRCVMREEGW